VATSLGDQGVVFHIASFEHSFYLGLRLATSVSCTLSFFVCITSTSVNLTQLPGAAASILSTRGSRLPQERTTPNFLECRIGECQI
jgi:hypothetical protein